MFFMEHFMIHDKIYVFRLVFKNTRNHNCICFIIVAAKFSSRMHAKNKIWSLN